MGHLNWFGGSIIYTQEAYPRVFKKSNGYIRGFDLGPRCSKRALNVVAKVRRNRINGASIGWTRSCSPRWNWMIETRHDR